jgi:hypothetical protein
LRLYVEAMDEKSEVQEREIKDLLAKIKVGH